MTYRPYPNADRARAQVHRGRRPQPPSELQVRLAEQANAALEHAGRVIGPVMEGMRDGLSRVAWERAVDGPMWEPGLKVVAPPVGEYVLSTRPGVVGGGS
jgi:hypothetical protein